jgi:hypothetical protein
VPKLAFKRASIDPELYADVMRMRQNCAKYASAVNSLNAKADDKRKYKPVFGVLKTKEGKPDYLKTGVYALSFLPPLRRMQSSFDAAEDENYFRVAGMAAVAAANLPSDLKDMALAVAKPIKPQTHQPFSSFFRGTCLNFLTEKYKWLGNFDKTLFDTKLGKFVLDRFNINLRNDLKKIKATGKLSKDMIAIGFEGNIFKQTIGTSLLRTNVIGLGLSCLFELPAIINSAKKGNTFGEKTKSVVKQSLKSAANVLLITGGIAITGALFYTGAGFAASLFGMAIGSTLGIQASKNLNKLIDKA